MAVSNNNSNRNNGRFALIIANSKYEDPDLQNLAAAGQDAEALSFVLKNVDIGDFEVEILKNEPSYKVSEAIEKFFSDRYYDNLLLLYFSCHGIKDVDGRLYYATINTRRKLLASTAISANFVNEVMLRSRSRRQMLIIDCCYGGAFARGMHHKADKVVHTGEQFEGRGRIVLTASDSMQYSFEGDRREGVGERSIFTHALVQGLETGEADIDKNSLVSYTELYNYAYDRVIDETPMQKPGMWVFGLEGDVVVAKNPHKNKIEEVSSEKDPNDLILDASENLKRGDYNSTIEYSDNAIKINPRFAVAYNIKGLALFNSKRYDEAILCYEKALQLRPKYIEAIINRGLALAKIGNYNKAIESFNRSSDLNPNDARNWNYKGLALHALGKYDNAIESFDEALRLSPTYTEALNNRVSSSQLKKKTQDLEYHQPQPLSPPTSSKTEVDFAVSRTVSGGAVSPETYSQNTSPSPSIKKDVPSDTSKPQEVIPIRSIYDPSDYATSTKKETKASTVPSGTKLQRNKLKILIPIVVVIIGAVIAFIVYSNGIVPQPPTTGNHTSPPAVNPEPNHPPSATEQSVTTSMNKAVDITLAGSDQDQNDTLSAAIVTNPSHGTLGDINQDTAVVTYTPNQDFIGDDSFTFKVSDGKTNSENTAAVKIRVNGAAINNSNTFNLKQATSPPSNSPPSATEQSVTTSMNKAVDITLAGSDQDQNDTLSAAIVTNPSHGTLGDINQDTAVVTYTPNQDFIGDDSFTFKVSDGKTNSENTAAVKIRVNGAAINNSNTFNLKQATSPPSNSPPSATEQSVTTSMNKAVDITLAGSDQDQNDTLSAAIVTNPSHGTLGDINQDTAVVTYTPNQDFIGDDSFTFKVSDGKTNSRNIGTIKITVK